jgi:ADP-ribosyl-[dinitrogen reductase] hydrolase
MLWFHLPIVDGSIPSQKFEQKWEFDDGKKLLSMLRRKLDVLVHCRGGLGRAGTIAARLLVELGMEPKKAIESVRAARPDAIETPEQMRYVLDLRKPRK